MSRIVRMTSSDAVHPESLERLRKLAEKSETEIDTTDIGEKSFDLKLAAKRRREGWQPGHTIQRKAG